MMANDIRRCPPIVLVHWIFPAASHRRMVRVHTPIIEAAIPIRTRDVMIPCSIQYRHLNPDIIHAVSNFVYDERNCLATQFSNRIGSWLVLERHVDRCTPRGEHGWTSPS